MSSHIYFCGQLPFRLSRAALDETTARFNERAELCWFGFQRLFNEAAVAVVHLTRHDADDLGGRRRAALNGGLISAGFDAAAVLVGVCHSDIDTVVTIELSVRFLRLPHVEQADQFAARVVRLTNSMAFVGGALRTSWDGAQFPFATLTAMIAPA